MVGAYRLILALMVLGSHSFSIWEHYPDPGLIAVVTFFFISGFLMPATFEANYCYPAFGTRATMFYWARFLRIYPMYWIALFIGVAVVPFVVGVPNQYDGGLLHAGVQNFLLLGLNQASFWSSETRVVNVAWTLDIELQFYLLVPFLVLLCRRAPAVLYSILAALSLYSVWRLAHPADITGVDRSFMAYSVYFCAGFICYMRREAFRNRANSLALCSIGISLVACALIWHEFGGHSSEWPLSVAFVGIAVLCLFNRAPAFRWDKYLGDLSYPVFLFHNFIRRSFASLSWTQASPHGEWLTFLFSAMVSIAFSALIERLVSPTINGIRDKAKMRQPWRETRIEMAAG